MYTDIYIYTDIYMYTDIYILIYIYTDYKNYYHVYVTIIHKKQNLYILSCTVVIKIIHIPI